MQRKKIIVGNWKMYKTAQEARAFVSELTPQINPAKVQILLAVPFTALHAASAAAKGGPLLIGAQNMHDVEEGAFTGEISSRMLKDAGAHFVLLGHSERRQYFYETDAFIHRKLKTALASGITPVLCVGETQEERQKGKTEAVLMRQLKETLEGQNDLSSLIVAYEPVWAIGTGNSATPQMVQLAHGIVRTYLSKIGAKNSPILYGGSVKADTIAPILEMPDVDGALVGGASLGISSFAKIIEQSSNVGLKK